jgi:hypothetical protein
MIEFRKYWPISTSISNFSSGIDELSFYSSKFTYALSILVKKLKKESKGISFSTIRKWPVFLFRYFFKII